MRVAHFICHRSADKPGLTNLTYNKTTKLWLSGYWDIPISDAERLVGGVLFLHEAKSDPSVFGGRVVECRQVKMEDYAHSRRIVFLIEAIPEGKGRKWEGREHGMAHYSGIIEID